VNVLRLLANLVYIKSNAQTFLVLRREQTERRSSRTGYITIQTTWSTQLSSHGDSALEENGPLRFVSLFVRTIILPECVLKQVGAAICMQIVARSLSNSCQAVM
jgi:hypothetical protein